MRWYGGLLECRGSHLTPLKSTFNAEHFVDRLSWSIFNVLPVMISSKSVSICNHSHAILVDSSRNRTFHGGAQV